METKADLITDYDPFKYLWAYDPVIKRRTVHVIKGKMAVSLVTSHRFKLNENQIKEFKEKGGNKMENNDNIKELLFWFTTLAIGFWLSDEIKKEALIWKLKSS